MNGVAVRVDVPQGIIRWARERSGVEAESLVRRFPRLPQWESGDASPTLKQLEAYARATHTPVGYLFLADPPDESVPIPDFRTFADEPVARPSPDLLDTVYACQQRQEWFREYAQVNQLDPVPFVGSATTNSVPTTVVSDMERVLGFDVDERGSTWADAFRRLADSAEDARVLVMVSGVVGSNTRRKLDPTEFRGFSLVDPLAPVVFVNGADTRAAQIFTLAHELAHLWLGEPGLDDIDLFSRETSRVESWCNEVAARFLVPVERLREEYAVDQGLVDQLDGLAHRFKVSTLVVLRRLYEAEYLVWDEYRIAYRQELARLLPLLEQSRGSGGNFYNTQPSRVSKLFARSVITSTLEGHTLYTEAFQMLGFKRQKTFEELAQRLGIA